MIKIEGHRKQQLSWLISWEIFFWTCLFMYTEVINSGKGELVYRWKHPEVMWLSIVILPIYWYAFKKKTSITTIANRLPKQLRSLTFPGLKVSYSAWPLFFIRNLIVFLILTMAQPIAGKEKVAASTTSGEIVICLDVSNSMNTKDIDPTTSRLEVAKRAMTELLNNLSGERIGISVFAGNAFVQLPITSDYLAAKVYINEIETNMLSNQGTTISKALSTSINQFSEDNANKTLLLVTDGEDHASIEDSNFVALKEKDISLCVIGIGMPTGGPVPMDANRPELGFKKDDSDNIIISKPNKKLVSQLAERANGIAVMVTDPYPSLDQLLTEINQKRSNKKGTLQLDVERNNYQIPLLLALLSWIGWFLLSYRLFERPRK